MRRFAKFLKDTFSVTSLQRLPATSSEMTLHDALRICDGVVQIDEPLIGTDSAELTPISDDSDPVGTTIDGEWKETHRQSTDHTATESRQRGEAVRQIIRLRLARSVPQDHR